MLYLYGLSFLSAYESGGMIPVQIGIFSMLLRQLLSVEGVGVHCNQSLHPVAPVNVQSPACRTHSVGGIDVSAMLLVVFVSPVVLVLVPERIEVMYVCSFGVDDLTEEALLGHVERGEFEEVIYAVLEHHAVAHGPFCCVHQLPAFLDAHGCRDLHCDMLAMLHRIYRHGHMSEPRRHYIYKVYVLPLA